MTNRTYFYTPEPYEPTLVLLDVGPLLRRGDDAPTMADVVAAICNPEGDAMPDIDQSEFCQCDMYTGSERNALGVKVCERCGKPDDPRDTVPFR